MSVIRALPYIVKLLNKMNSTEISTLKSVINGGGTFANVKISSLPSKGTITPCYLDFENGQAKNGILVYVEDHSTEATDYVCVLIAYNRFHDIRYYEIDAANHTYTLVDEQATIDELRREVWDSEFKEDAETGKMVINGGMEVDENGDVTIGRDLYVEDEIVIDSDEKIVDTDGNPIQFGKNYGLVNYAGITITESTTIESLVQGPAEKLEDGKYLCTGCIRYNNAIYTGFMCEADGEQYTIKIIKSNGNLINLVIGSSRTTFDEAEGEFSLRCYLGFVKITKLYAFEE